MCSHFTSICCKMSFSRIHQYYIWQLEHLEALNVAQYEVSDSRLTTDHKALPSPRGVFEGNLKQKSCEIKTATFHSEKLSQAGGVGDINCRNDLYEAINFL